MYHHVFCPNCDAAHIVVEPSSRDTILRATSGVVTAVATTWIGSRDRALGLATTGVAWVSQITYYVNHSLVTCENCEHRYFITFADRDESRA
jgi:hypothetical protein